MLKNKTLAGILCGLSGAVLFGFSFLFTKSGINSTAPMTLLGWRFIFAFLFMSLCLPFKILKVNYKGKPVLKVILLAAFQPVLYFIGESYGVGLTTTSETGAIIAMIPVLTMLLSALILKEAPTALQAAGIVISLTGIFMIVLSKGLSASFSIPGYLLLFMAAGAFVFGGGAVFENIKLGSMSEFLRLPFTNTYFLIAILYLSLGCTILAFILSIYSISILGPTRSASYAPLTTVVSIAAGVILLREEFSWMQGIGSVLTLTGIILTNKTKALPEVENCV